MKFKVGKLDFQIECILNITDFFYLKPIRNKSSSKDKYNQSLQDRAFSSNSTHLCR